MRYGSSPRSTRMFTLESGYAECTLVPRERDYRCCLPVRTLLTCDVMAALPATWLTAWSSLVGAMDVQAEQTLLISGGTSLVGMAAASLARHHRLTGSGRSPRHETLPRPQHCVRMDLTTS